MGDPVNVITGSQFGWKFMPVCVQLPSFFLVIFIRDTLIFIREQSGCPHLPFIGVSVSYKNLRATQTKAKVGCTDWQ